MESDKWNPIISSGLEIIEISQLIKQLRKLDTEINLNVDATLNSNSVWDYALWMLALKLTSHYAFRAKEGAAGT